MFLCFKGQHGRLDEPVFRRVLLHFIEIDAVLAAVRFDCLRKLAVSVDRAAEGDRGRLDAREQSAALFRVPV